MAYTILVVKKNQALFSRLFTCPRLKSMMLTLFFRCFLLLILVVDRVFGGGSGGSGGGGSGGVVVVVEVVGVVAAEWVFVGLELFN